MDGALPEYHEELRNIKLSSCEPMAEEKSKSLEFNALYLETEILVRSNWPSETHPLQSVLVLASRWGMRIFLPAPVECQIEARCLRKYEESTSILNGAVKKTSQLLRPLGRTADVDCLKKEEFCREYRGLVTRIKVALKIEVIPFSSHGVQDFFDLAIHYQLPFEPGQEGKGFQDAVILASVLEHLSKNKDVSGVLITMDKVFEKVQRESFRKGYAELPLKVMPLETLWDLMYSKYWDENIEAPWKEERANAKAAAEKVDF